MRYLVLLMLDLFIALLATLLSLALRENFEIGSSRFLDFLPYLTATAASALFVLPATGLNRCIWRYTSAPDYLRVVSASAAIVIGAVSIAFAYNRLDGVARSLPFLQFLACQALLIGARVAHKISHDIRQHHKASGAFLQLTETEATTTVLVVGISKLTEAYLQAVAEFARGRIKIAGLVGQAGRHVGRLVAAHPVLGLPREIETVLDGLEVHGVSVDRIVVATPFYKLAAPEREALLRAERSRDVTVEFLSQTLGFGDDEQNSPPRAGPARQKSSHSSELCFEISPSELTMLASRRYWAVRRAMDVLAASTLLVIGSPVLVMAALAVMASVGSPVLFWQQRPGLGGRPFRLYKFRTMKAAHSFNGRRLSDKERVSPIGSQMRRLRLDELPQLFNIVRGDMSFIGPRPLLAREQLNAHRARLLVRPGLTGWAQVVGGRDISVEDKAALDVWYVRNASLALDLKIVAKTVPMVLLGERISRPLIERAWGDLSEAGILKGELAFSIGKRLQPTPFLYRSLDFDRFGSYWLQSQALFNIP